MRPLRLAATTASLVVLSATGAIAHPGFDPNAVPVGEPVETTLVVPHGCSTGDSVRPAEGEAVPTTRFDLQLLDGITVEPDEVDGWVVEDDGEAIVWTADGGATAEPIEFPVTLTVTEGAAGDQVEIAAFQECEDGSSYRWTGGSEGTPPVRLELTEGETGTVDVADGGHGSETDMDGETPSAVEPRTETPPGPSSPEAASLQPLPEAEFTTEDDASPTVIVIAVVAVVLAVAVAVTLVVRRRSA